MSGDKFRAQRESDIKEVIDLKIQAILKLAPEWKKRDAVSFLLNRATRKDPEWRYLEYLHDQEIERLKRVGRSKNV